MEAIEHILPMAGKLTIIGVLCVIIYFLWKENKELNKKIDKKEEQLKGCIDVHLEDMRVNYKDMQTITDKFNVFANELKDIIRTR
jgi:hypothetical protein